MGEIFGDANTCDTALWSDQSVVAAPLVSDTLCKVIGTTPCAVRNIGRKEAKSPHTPPRHGPVY